MPAAAATAVRVLIVEDDPDTSEAIAAVLALHGFDVEVASTVGEALVKLERGLVPRALVLDLGLPDASGSLLLRRIHRDDLPIAVAVVTGLPDAESHPALVRFPPDRVFTKPLGISELAEWLASLA